jgi:hypothetical protein
MRKSAAVCLLLGALALAFQAGCKSVSPEELKASMEIIDLQTKWVSKHYQPWPQRLILVPVVSFRVKNLTAKPLTYVNFNAIFKFKGDQENLGDCFLAAIRKDGIPPGGTSAVITLKSNLGVDGKTVEGIRNNPAWRPTEVNLFSRSKGSAFVLLGTWDISREIDFVPPTDPVPAPKEPEKK